MSFLTAPRLYKTVVYAYSGRVQWYKNDTETCQCDQWEKKKKNKKKISVGSISTFAWFISIKLLFYLCFVFPNRIRYIFVYKFLVRCIIHGMKLQTHQIKWMLGNIFLLSTNAKVFLFVLIYIKICIIYKCIYLMIYGLLIFVVLIRFFSFFFLFQFLNIILMCQKINIKKTSFFYSKINIYNNIVYYYIYYNRNAWIKNYYSFKKNF